MALFVWVLCLFQAESSACLPTSYLVVPILVATQEIHHGTYIVSHVVGHDAPKLLQKNEIPLLLVGYFLCTEYLGEIVLDFWMFSIKYCT